jgi:4a-hydroxytetrahydrobiopterin dehydratase
VAIRPDEQRLKEPLLTELLSSLDGWTSDGTRLEKTFVRKGWKSAIAFVKAIAGVADDADHHPDIHVEGYRKVRVVLTTHASGGISRSDVDLARTIDRLAALTPPAGSDAGSLPR